MKSRNIIVHVVCLLLFVAVAPVSGQSPLRIGISKASPNYVRWLHRTDPALELVDLYPMTNAQAVAALENCHALLLTGGEDVYPGWHGKEADTGRCTDINRRRDTLDMQLIAKAMEMKLPVLGICRGHQILNVYLGGDLIIDIPEDWKDAGTHQCEDYLKCFHSVTTVPGSELSVIAGVDSGIVTTNHHQAIGRIAPDLRANAYSADGVIEGAEWRKPSGKMFMMGVQWHPERMQVQDPLSQSLVVTFLSKAKEFQTSR